MASREDYGTGDAENLQRRASGLKDEAVERGLDELDQSKRAAAAETEKMADAVHETAQRLEGKESSLAGYAEQLSGALQSAAESLKTRSVNELARDLAAMAHRNPATFVLASVGVGLALGRFMKASGARAPMADRDADEASRRASETPARPADEMTSDTDVMDRYGAPPPTVHGAEEPPEDSPTQFSGA